MVTIAVRATAGRYRVPSALQTYPNNRSVTSGGNRSPIVSDHVGRDDGTRETAHRLKVPMDRTTRETLHRSREYGAVLLQHGLRQCDRESLPCISVVVQPTKQVSLPKAGFEIVATIQAGSSPPIVLMVRHAR